MDDSVNVTIIPIPAAMPPEGLLYRRIYVRRRDLFGEVVGLHYVQGCLTPCALVKFEWPHAPTADPEHVDLLDIQLVIKAPSDDAAEEPPADRGSDRYRLLIERDDWPDDHRFAWLLVTDTILVEILKGFAGRAPRAFTVAEHALPGDARPIGYRWHEEGVIALLLHSSAFDHVPESEQAPTLPAPVLQVAPAGGLPQPSSDRRRQDRPPQ